MLQRKIFLLLVKFMILTWREMLLFVYFSFCKKWYSSIYLWVYKSSGFYFFNFCITKTSWKSKLILLLKWKKKTSVVLASIYGYKQKTKRTYKLKTEKYLHVFSYFMKQKTQSVSSDYLKASNCVVKTNPILQRFYGLV